MANRDLTIRFLGDSKDFTRAAKEAISNLDGTESAAEAVARAMEALATKADAEMRDAAAATEVLSAALGTELVADIKRAGGSIDSMVADLQRAGLTYDEIRADADRLAEAIKAMSDAGRTAGADIDAGARQADDGLRRVSESGDASRSVLANLAGNATQDLGELGGVAGTAGVAIGQLAEYAVDGNISLSGLAKVAGPMAAVGLAVAGVSWAIGQMRARSEEAKRETEALIKVQEQLRDGKFADAAAEIASEYEATIPLLQRYGLSTKDLVAQMLGQADVLPQLKDRLSAVQDELKETTNKSGEHWNAMLAEQNQLLALIKTLGEAETRYQEGSDQLAHTATVTNEAEAALRELTATADETAPAITRVDRSAQDYADEIKRAEDATRMLDDAYATLTGSLNEQEAWDNFIAKMWEFHSSTDRTEAETRDYIRSLAEMVVGLKGVPEETKAKLIAQLNEGDVAVVEAYLTEWGKGIDVPVRFKGQGNVGFEKKAAGGLVSAGQPVIVGDNPDGSMNSTSEVFVPAVPGRILSTPQARRAMSGAGQRSGDTITVNLYGTDVTAGQVVREIAWQRMVG